MNKNCVGKVIGALSLFSGGVIIGAAAQEEIRCRNEKKQRKEEAAENRLWMIEERLRVAEAELEKRDEAIKKLTKQLEKEKTEK